MTASRRLTSGAESLDPLEDQFIETFGETTLAGVNKAAPMRPIKKPK